VALSKEELMTSGQACISVGVICDSNKHNVMQSFSLWMEIYRLAKDVASSTYVHIVHDMADADDASGLCESQPRIYFH
jgi:hypothetical protein